MGEFSLNCRNCLKGQRTACEFEIPGQDVWEINGEQFRGCPFKIVTRQSASFLRAFYFFRKGYLPNAGTWLEQPAKMLDAFEVIDKELKDMEIDNAKRMNK